MELAIAVPLSMAIGYALGSVPWAYLIALRKGVRIDQVGTGISGAANVYRNVGHTDGIVVFVLDAAMGALAVLVANLLGADGWQALPAMGSAIVGHVFPAFGLFPLGVGLATFAGGAGAIGGWVGLVAVLVGVLGIGTLRNTGKAGGLGVAAFVILGFVFGLEWQTNAGVFALSAAVLVWSKVRERLRRESLH